MRSSRRPFSTFLSLFVIAAASLVLPGAGALARPDRGPEGPIESRGDIIISSNDQFTADRGVRSGVGTKESPYVISGWSLPSLVIQNTDAWVTIRDNQVTGTMILDWVGDRVEVRNNDVGDMRVNQNVARTGAATDGTISGNHFNTVSQLRHWDGIFENNQIGAAGNPQLLQGRAFLIDGFNDGVIRNNVIYGFVDMKLHGHHHSGGFGENSHDHSGGEMPPMPGMEHGMVDHSKRYHEGWFVNNKIFAEHDWAFRYYDTAHAGDDRTNASETDKLLSCPHVHYTRVHVASNELNGSGLWVDVFNAPDENHWDTSPGLVEVTGNDINLGRDVSDLVGGRFGIYVRQAVDLSLKITGNTIMGPNSVGQEEDLLGLEEQLLGRGAGIRLDTLDQSNVYIAANHVGYRTFGVQATNFTPTVKWRIKGLSTEGVSKDVEYDKTVSRRPQH